MQVDSGALANNASKITADPSYGVSVLQFKTVKPAGERVLIKLGTPEAKTASGILLPSAKDTDRPEGEVVAVGEGKALKV
jgi:hypothetical protein